MQCLFPRNLSSICIIYRGVEDVRCLVFVEAQEQGQQELATFRSAAVVLRPLYPAKEYLRLKFMYWSNRFSCAFLRYFTDLWPQTKKAGHWSAGPDNLFQSLSQSKLIIILKLLVISNKNVHPVLTFKILINYFRLHKFAKIDTILLDTIYNTQKSLYKMPDNLQ